MNSVDMIARCARFQQPEPRDVARRVCTLRADERIVPYQPMTEADAEQEVTAHTGLALVVMAAGSGVVLLAVWAAWALAIWAWQ